MSHATLPDMSTLGNPVRQRPDFLRWSLAGLAASTFFALGIAFSAPPKVAATQEAESLPTFLRFGKNYICLQKISHIIDDPGQTLPPGSITVYFSGGNVGWINLFGEEATAFRSAVDELTTDLTPAPKPGAAEAAARKAALRNGNTPIEIKAAPSRKAASTAPVSSKK